MTNMKSRLILHVTEFGLAALSALIVFHALETLVAQVADHLWMAEVARMVQR